MLIYSQEKAQIRQKLLCLQNSLSEFTVQLQELYRSVDICDVVRRSTYLNINHAIIRAMSAGYSEYDAKSIVQEALNISDEVMTWANTYNHRIKKGYQTYAQVYLAKRMKAKGFSTRQIADILEVSPSTVLERLKKEQNEL